MTQTATCQRLLVCEVPKKMQNDRGSSKKPELPISYWTYGIDFGGASYDTSDSFFNTNSIQCDLFIPQLKVKKIL